METKKKLKKELRELNFFIILSRVLLFLYKKSTIQILGLLIAAFWSWASYKWTGNLIAAPFVVAGMFVFVRFGWVPAMTKGKDVKEMETDISKYQKERDEILIQLK
jgi:hypothetical protein